MPECSTDTLQAMTTEELLDWLRAQKDHVPRNVIDECARRGAPMTEALGAFLDSEAAWSYDASEGDWWLVLHAAHILGLIESKAAGDLLIKILLRLETVDTAIDLWAAHSWPGWFRNKPDTVLAELHVLLGDVQTDYLVREHALDVLSHLGACTGGAALDRLLDLLAEIAAKKHEDPEMRMKSTQVLLDFAPPRHRALLTSLASRSSGFPFLFDTAYVNEVFDQAPESLELEPTYDAWLFYTPVGFERRRQALEAESSPASLNAVQSPHVRTAPKVGRNDPCPCGSGKKYKKCCLAGDA